MLDDIKEQEIDLLLPVIDILEKTLNIEQKQKLIAIKLRKGN
jgi:hypothetical protein